MTNTDSAFLGHLGTEELAASSLAQVWTSVPLMAVWAASSSLITLCGQAWGAGNKELTGVRERMRAFCCVAFTTDIPRFHRSFHAREHRLHFAVSYTHLTLPTTSRV